MPTLCSKGLWTSTSWERPMIAPGIFIMMIREDFLSQSTHKQSGGWKLKNPSWVLWISKSNLCWIQLWYWGLVNEVYVSIFVHLGKWWRSHGEKREEKNGLHWTNKCIYLLICNWGYLFDPSLPRSSEMNVAPWDECSTMRWL